MELLTRREKDAIRAQPCGKCGEIPPFSDGSRCHPHRLVRALGYVVGNVVPRCPDCHATEPGHTALTKVARKAWLICQERHPEMAAANAHKGGLVSQAKRTPAERSAIGRMAAAALTPAERSAKASKAVGRAHALHPEMARENGRKGGRAAGLALKAKLTPAEYSEMRRRGWATRRAAAVVR